MYYATSGNNGTNYRYGTKITNLPDFEQGTLDGNGNKIYYTYGFNNLSDKDKYSGIWGADINYPTPLQYPTTSDEVMAVRASNEALVYNLRSFGLPGGNTPLGGMVHMMYYLFNNTEKSTEGVVDPGLKLQPMPNGKYIEPVRDNAWACRAKAVVAMTDGSPVSDTYDEKKAAEELYRQGVKVYSVAYANGGAKADSGYGATMNKMAWKGGTCREFGHTGEIIDPSDQAGYDKYIANYKKDKTKYGTCFYDAYNGIALREAMIAIMSELMEGYTSKSKMVTTTAVGKLTTVDSEKKPINGWYNVYSGYRVNLGAMRNSGLQRETYVCKDGEFGYAKELFLDMAKKLDNRLVGCRTNSMLFDSDEKGPKGDCIKNRAIFVGDYSSRDETFSSGRYALKPKKIHFSEAEAGKIYHGTSGKYYQFFAYNEDRYSEFLVAKNSVITQRDDNVNERVTNYIVSPYECKSEIDCIGMSDDIEKQYMCDKGKCVLQSTLQNLTSCTSSLSACNANQVCIYGQCRPMGAKCDQHSDCMSGSVDSVNYNAQNQVCHAGSCVNGVLIDGDIRDLIASIPLGAIEYASPVIVGPPSYSYHGADYVTFKNKYAERDTMLYVPANDGMLHAFILGKNNTKNYSGAVFSSLGSPKFRESDATKLEGEELWAFIPKAVMRNIHTLTDFGEQKKINVAPVYADVQFPDGHGGGEWHSVIVGGFREGGRGYYALDVTEPENPKILWEIDHQWQNTSRDIPYPEINNDMALSVAQEKLLKDDGLYPFARMGYSYPEAIITNVIVDNEIVPVAILPGGVASGNLTTDCVMKGTEKVCFDDVTGKAVFVVRLNPSSKDDLLVREFQFDTRISGTPSAFPAGFNSIARVIYVGDENGALHRIDVSDPNMNNWKIDGNPVSTEGKIAKPVGSLHPIFDPNNIGVLQGTTRKKYEKITYKPAVSALTSTGFPDIEIVFGSGDSSITSIGPRDLNYTAIAIDHYVNDKIGYQLNNFNQSHEIPAHTDNLSPLVIVFNPTPGITSKPLDSYGVPGGKKQYFEVWAGQVADDPTDIGGEIDDPDVDLCNLCTKELCQSPSSSCSSECDICKCYEKEDECDEKIDACKECVAENKAKYDECQKNVKTSSECVSCTAPCHVNCDKTEKECQKDCHNEAEHDFCGNVCKSSVISALTYLWGGCSSECSSFLASIRGYVETWQVEYAKKGGVDNYCAQAKNECDAYCSSTGFVEYEQKCIEDAANCVDRCHDREEECDNNCDSRRNTCYSNSSNSYNSCKSGCSGLFGWICEAGCWTAHLVADGICAADWGICRVGCNQFVCDIGCAVDWTWCAVAGCQANCTTDKWDCDIRASVYKLLKQFRDWFDAQKEECNVNCTSEKLSCYMNCDDVTCKEKCTCKQEPCEGGAMTASDCKCNPEDLYNDDEKLMCSGLSSDDSKGGTKTRSMKRSASAPVIDFDIRSGQKMMGPALTYNFKTYFPTYNATLTSGACNDGFASIWSIDDRVNSGLFWQTKNRTQVQNYKNNTITGAKDHGKTETSFEKNYYVNLANGTKVYGLAMTPQAICVKGNKAQVVAPQLIAQTGRAPGATGGSESAANDFSGAGDKPNKGEATDIKVLSITEEAIKAVPRVLSWASVYE